jgi:hypothetical protein
MRACDELKSNTYKVTQLREHKLLYVLLRVTTITVICDMKIMALNTTTPYVRT